MCGVAWLALCAWMLGVGDGWIWCNQMAVPTQRPLPLPLLRASRLSPSRYHNSLSPSPMTRAWECVTKSTRHGIHFSAESPLKNNDLSQKFRNDVETMSKRWQNNETMPKRCRNNVETMSMPLKYVDCNTPITSISTKLWC